MCVMYLIDNVLSEHFSVIYKKIGRLYIFHFNKEYILYTIYCANVIATCDDMVHISPIYIYSSFPSLFDTTLYMYTRSLQSAIFCIKCEHLAFKITSYLIYTWRCLWYNIEPLFARIVCRLDDA